MWRGRLDTHQTRTTALFEAALTAYARSLVSVATMTRAQQTISIFMLLTSVR
jgi:hypothetical protein